MQKILHAGLKIVHIGLKNAEKHYIWTIFGHICLKLGQSEFCANQNFLRKSKPRH